MIDFYKEYGNVFLINVPRRFYDTEIDLLLRIAESGYKDKSFILSTKDYYQVICFDTFSRRAYDLKDFLSGRHCSKLDTFTSGFFLEYLQGTKKEDISISI